MDPQLRDRPLELLRAIAGPDARFRPGQLEAIEALVGRRSKALVVQRTGWGKSAVYLIATRLLRDQGRGPTVIVSPLLALMNNQLEMAQRAAVEAETINSNTRDDWDAIEEGIRQGEVDFLLISPERLANERFRQGVLPHLVRNVGLLVVDEVHCISDWGHDFRPDYRRLSSLVRALPPGVPVLGTTATANNRVVDDVVEQLGDDLEVFRGTLEREGLGLQVIDMPNRAERLAWLTKTVPNLRGSGIIYTLTVKDAHRVGRFLDEHGIDVAAYTGGMDPEARLGIERLLSEGELKAVVATSALGMGYDNPFIEFVIHYQMPGSPIAYYQQVGRAGRAVDESYGILLTGVEDSDIQDYFIRTAFPSRQDVEAVLAALVEPQRLMDLERIVNLPRGRLSGLLKILEVEGAVFRDGSRWQRTAITWTYPEERLALVTAHRRSEQRVMQEYVSTGDCLMQVLRRELDDPAPEQCGLCASCLGEPLLSPDVDEALVQEAVDFLNRSWVPIEPRQQGVASLGLSLRGCLLEEGRALSVWGDPGWARQVARGKYETGTFGDHLVEGVVEMIEQWRPDPFPTWVTAIPSNRHPELVRGFARSLAQALGLEFVDALVIVADRPPQKGMENSAQQARNVIGRFEVTETRPGPVFLVDDMVDSKWTVTIAGRQLIEAGTGPVYPVALADTSRSGA